VVEIEIEKAALIADAFQNLVIGLRRHDHEHAKNQRRQQPQGTGSQQLTCGQFAEHELRRRPGNQKQQRQPPRIEQQHQRFQLRNPVRALDMKAPGHMEHADVVEDQEPEG
jgi:hypothetical protein